MPVLGASLIILAAREKSPLTGNAVAQQIGKWSYSIYLWHWPVFVGLGYYGLQGFVPAAGGILCALMLGAASRWAIETPGRERLGRMALKPSLGVLGGPCAADRRHGCRHVLRSWAGEPCIG
jgi:peptidoglycan/LPS O-acetylase OafA/YrhL